MKTPMKCGNCLEFRHAWGRLGSKTGWCLLHGIVVAADDIPCSDQSEARKLWAKRMAGEVNVFSLGD